MNTDSEFTTRPLDDSGEVLFGSGGTADCYKRIIGNRTYCIKRPKAAWKQSEDYMNLFQKEFALGIELEHPNIVRYFDYGEDEKGPFIKMDYVDGDPLELFVAQHPDYFQNQKHCQQFLNELTNALAYLHGKQMLHLDLKPGNILITHNGHHVKLIDLGFGWTDGFLHDSGFSRDYCAPEQLRQQNDQLCPATDIYALGKVMQRFHLAKDSVVKRCLKDDPKERYQSIESLKKALQPRRWPYLLAALLVVGTLVGMFATTFQPFKPLPVPHDTIYVKQVDTIFMPEPKPELTLDDSLTLFKEELQNILAPTFSYWYGLIDNMFKQEPNLTNEFYLETSKYYIDQGVSISRKIIKERLNTMHLSKASRPAFEKAGQEVIDYYLRDYRKLKKRLTAP